ncbi:MAG: FAD-dependent thymidylate synthase [archaeon]|nr:FAD-dependent thymidylate synthase [Nanoarchaeota archaeon]
MQEKEFLNTTGTLGPCLEDREFTDDEKVVLTHFFTNINKNIYAATDAMPNSLWALLEGGYSRSQGSMRMRFLTIFDEMQTDFENGKLSQEDLVTVKDFADQIRTGSNLNMGFFLSKAEQFMRKWAVQYGHDSLKDSDVVRFAIENITQTAVNPIQEARLGAYQEKSTRYVPFSRDHLVIPTDLQEFSEDIKMWNNLLITSYEESQIIVSEFIRKKLNKEDFKTEAAFNRTINAKTFDIIRYFLPSTMLTSLGVVWPTREAERHISYLLSDEREEIRNIGKCLLEEGKKVSPGLLSHVAVNEYQITRRKNAQLLRNLLTLNKPLPEAGRTNKAVKLIHITPNIEAHIAATILFRNCSQGNSYQEFFEMCKDNFQLVDEVFKTYLAQRGKFDPFPMPTETGNIIFELMVDYGAYRDIKRHRRNLFLRAPVTASLGFEYPEHVANEPDLIEVKQKIEHCAKYTQQLHEKIKVKYPRFAEYVVMFAQKQRILWQMDPRQFVYVTELRTTPAGHHSYRTICQEMFNVVMPHMPTLSKYVRVDFSSGDEGRKKQEEKTVEKLQKLGADLERVTL